MRRINSVLGLVAFAAAPAFANPEMTVELPGGVTMEFVWIEPGTFVMGSPDSEVGRGRSEGPQHEVTISAGFYLGKYEITQGQWEALIEHTEATRRTLAEEVQTRPWADPG